MKICQLNGFDESRMRYPTDYKQQARSKLIEAGGRHAKAHGFTGSGIAELAAAAGVTTGSVYKHFSGKSDWFVALVAAELKRTADLYGDIDPEDPAAAVRLLAGYLSLTHVQQPGSGCPLPSLTVEVGRAEDEVKAVFEQGVRTIHANVEALTGDADAAWALISQNVGAVMLARAMRSEALQRELLKAVRGNGEQLFNASRRAAGTRQASEHTSPAG